mmetsp:Transcript_139187/g.444791  ORF Transcript_139187/g.444791 Transcript_139187/m.444791 type:complete len:88 (+) Transcript_139187:174-437(+)
MARRAGMLVDGGLQRHSPDFRDDVVVLRLLSQSFSKFLPPIVLHHLAWVSHGASLPTHSINRDCEAAKSLRKSASLGSEVEHFRPYS